MNADSGSLPDTVRRWREMFEAGSADGVEDLMAEDITLHSPLTNAFTFDGPQNVAEVFRVVVRVVSEIRYHTILAEPTASGSSTTWALIASGFVDGEPMEEVVLMTLNSQGLIRDMTLFGRPLPSLTAVMRDIAGPLLAAQGRSTLGRLTGPANAPLALITKLVERHVMPRLAPRRR